MGPIVTDRVAWSVCLSVCHSSEPCKTAEPIEMPFGLWARLGSRNHVFDGAQIPHRKGQFSVRKGADHCKVYRHSVPRAVQKTAEPIEMLFGLWTWLGPRKHVLGGVRSGATWRIPLNRPYAAAMWLYVKLLRPLAIPNNYKGSHRFRFLWPPYVIRQAIYYIFILWFLLLSFPRLISAVGDWMSTILPHMMWP